jgi:general secretion pathway protein A
MYASYFGLREAPFSVTPDPRLFYSNSLYQEALAALLYGIKNKKGFIVVTGDVGTGKTTLLRKLMRNLEATDHSVLIFNTHLSFLELLQLILHDLGLPTNRGKNKLAMIQELNQYLVEQLKNRHTVSLLIDEAQNLSDETLEGLRLLSNLETDKEKLLQIVLMGQPELDVKLNKPSLRQLKQRVAVRCGLDPLPKSEVGNYIHRRLELAGYEGPAIFSEATIESVSTYSGGTPRLINIICDNALLIAYATSQKTISVDIIKEVARDLRLELKAQPTHVKAKEDYKGTDNGEIRHTQVSPITLPSKNGQGTELQPIRITREDDRFLHLGSVYPTKTPVRPGAHYNTTNKEPISPNLLQIMIKALTEAMGPMAPLVVRDRIAALGESPETFPKRRLLELVELISREILNERLKVHFQQKISGEIHELTMPS